MLTSYISFDFHKEYTSCIGDGVFLYVHWIFILVCLCSIIDCTICTIFFLHLAFCIVLVNSVYTCIFFRRQAFALCRNMEFVHLIRSHELEILTLAGLSSLKVCICNLCEWVAFMFFLTWYFYVCFVKFPNQPSKDKCSLFLWWLIFSSWISVAFLIYIFLILYFPLCREMQFLCWHVTLTYVVNGHS